MFRLLSALLCISLLLTGCSGASAADNAPNTGKKFSTQIFAMDTVMELSVSAPDDSVLEDARSLIGQLEKKFSVTDPESEIYRLNHSGSAVLSEETGELLSAGLEFCRQTDGALDLSVYPVVRAWGFTGDSFRIPPQQQLDSLLEHVDYTLIRYQPDTRKAALPEGMEVDLGSVAKGYTGDKLIALFRKKGIESALLNLGGNVQALGSKPDGSPWRIGIRDPLGEGYLGVVSVEDRAVITSGGYERYFTGEDGKTYWHIIHPDTGYPARSGLVSATAIGTSGVYCDALSTSLFVMGSEKAIEFWSARQDFEMILVTQEHQVLLTPDLAENFTLTGASPYTTVVIGND